MAVSGYQLTLPSIPNLGDQPSESDLYYFKSLSSAVEHMVLGDRNPLWDNTVDLSRSISFVQPTSQLQGTLNDRIAHRFPVSDLNSPKDPTAVIQSAIRYARESPFVAKAAKVKTEFTMSKLTHKTLNTSVKEFYEKYIDALRLNIRIPEILFYCYAIGICIIWWGGEETRQIENLEIFDPRMCRVIYNFGKPSVFIRVDDDMRRAVADPEGKLDPRNRLKYQSMPQYWIAQIIANNNRGSLQGYIQLAEGSFAVLDTRLMKLSSVPGSFEGLPIQAAFEPLQRYKLMAAADYATAWNLKNMITLIKEGDPKAEGKEWKPVSTARLSNLQATFQRADSNYTVYCDATTTVEFVVPPIDKIFGTEKYQQVEKEIKENLGIPSFMWISEQGSNYSNAVNELKQFRVSCDFMWNYVLVEQFFKPLYARLRQGVARPGFKPSDIVYPEFNARELQDDANFMKQRTELYGRGLMSAQQICEDGGIDFEWMVQQKQSEKERFGPTKTDDMLNDTLLQPLFEPQQGNFQPEDPAGAPGTPGAPRGDGSAAPSGQGPRAKSK